MTHLIEIIPKRIVYIIHSLLITLTLSAQEHSDLDFKIASNESIEAFGTNQLSNDASLEYTLTGEWWKNWERCNNSQPVVEGESGTWKDGIVVSTILKDMGEYKMWFAGITANWKAQIGYATSPNGLNQWIIHENPVIPHGEPGSWDELRLPGTVLRVNDTLRLWYSGLDHDNGLVDRGVGYAWSLNGINWHVKEESLIDNHVDPVVYHDGSLYHMYYTDYDHDHIKYATSSDGINWDPYLNPVLSKGPSGSFYDYFVESGGILVHNDTIHMFFCGMNEALNSPSSRMRLGYAWSTDYKNFTIGNDGQPVFDVDENGWDSRRVRYPSLMMDNGLIKMWYTGNGSEWAIGLATLEGNCSETSISELRSELVQFNLYPNPVGNDISISFELSSKTNVILEIYNTHGQLISSLVKEVKEKGKHQIRYDCGSLPRGIYYCTLKTSESIMTKPIIKL